MDLLNIRSHFNESTRQAASTFLTPLTNAIGEQRRLVESLAIVSKVRVDECKHMMTWSKYQTEDLGDVLLKLNLLIRKISDYEIRFGTQYEGFREKIKYLRTKDNTLCEMGRLQTDLQTKIYESSKSKLRSAKALLLQKELDDIQKDSEPQETQLQYLKRRLIKEAYTEQMNAIVELGKKMQIIGEHGMLLIEHIDLTCTTDSYDDGHETEDILKAARIALENWDQHGIVDPQVATAHPPPPSSISLSGTLSKSDTSESLNSQKSKASVVISKDVPPLPPRSLEGSPAPGPLKLGHDNEDDEFISEVGRLRHLEDLEIKQALELSLAAASPSVKGKDIDDLNLSAEELRFVMGGMEPETSKTASKRQSLLATTAVKSASSNSSISKASKDPQLEQDLVTAKVTSAPKVIRVSESHAGHVQSHQAPRPWVSVKKPKKPEDNEAAAAAAAAAGVVAEELGDSSVPAETMGEDSSVPAETMGEDPDFKPRPMTRRNTAAEYYKALQQQQLPLESMGTEPGVAPESMGESGPYESNVPHVPMPQIPLLDDIRREKIQAGQQQQQDQPPPSPFPLSPELQYLQVNSPQIPPPQTPLMLSASQRTDGLRSLPISLTPTPAMYQNASYKPSTTYVPHSAKGRNRLSGSVTPPPPSSNEFAQLAQQKAYQLAHQKSYQLENQKSYQEAYQQQTTQQLDGDGSSYPSNNNNDNNNNNNNRSSCTTFILPHMNRPSNNNRHNNTNSKIQEGDPHSTRPGIGAIQCLTPMRIILRTGKRITDRTEDLRLRLHTSH
ncbi:Eisosome component PIL1-domain-containing protein [Dissophora ornata]|nr:Eisosome component PIL1-domain-containing protein [Dissophora ornata]